MIVNANIMQNVANKVIDKSAETAAQGLDKGVQTPPNASANAGDSQKFLNLMLGSQNQMPAQGVSEAAQIPGLTPVAQTKPNSVGDRILEGIAHTAKTQEADYHSAMGHVMETANAGTSPGDFLKAQIQLTKVETVQQMEGKAVSKADQTIDNLLKGG